MMKLLRFALLISLLTALKASAAVEWLALTHDFGAFNESDGQVACTFSFVNHGTEAVSIRSARASCGCTTPSFTKKPVNPGDTAVVTVAFNPSGRPGRFTKYITVDLAGDDAGPRQKLAISGLVIGSESTLNSRYPVVAGSMRFRTAIVPFGTVTKGKAKSAFVEVYNNSAAPITPTWVKKPAYVRTVASRDTILPGELTVYSLVLTPTETALYGLLTDSLTIAAPDGSSADIEISAMLEEDFSRLSEAQRAKAPRINIATERVDFGEFPTNAAPITHSFTIKNTGKSDLLLRRVYTLDRGVTVKAETEKIKKGKSGMVFVTIYPDQLTEPLLNAGIQVIANDPENPVTVVRVVGLPQ
jgi:hypothetical protein